MSFVQVINSVKVKLHHNTIDKYEIDSIGTGFLLQLQGM